MTVKEILTMASQFLNIEEEVKNYLQSDSEENVSATFKVLLNSLNIVNNEIASDYFPLLHCEEIDIQNNKIFYEDLAKEVKDVYSIKSLDESSEYRFRCYDEYLKVNAGGRVKIVYSYNPPLLHLTDNAFSFGGKINTRAFALAVASEYCYIKNIFDEAKVWHERFEQSLQNNLSKKGNLILPKRKWL